MPMNPRTHPRGTRPDFTLPRPNPNPGRMTDALWWLVCMRLALEPTSRNGGTFADKAGYHNAGENLPNHGQGSNDTDHSIRWAFDREGPWWREFTAAHDWTFEGAHTGDYSVISKYTKRLITAMKSLSDLRPDDVYAYTIGQADNDLAVEGWNERRDDDETGDDTHLWHRHDSFRRNIVGDFWAMWKALTIDMGWTYAEWQQSIEEDDVSAADVITALKSDEGKAAVYAAVNQDKVQRYDSAGVALKPDPAKPGEETMSWASALAYIGRDAILIRRALGLLGAKDLVDEDAIAAAVVAALGGSSDADLAAALKAALGDRAAAVGLLLAA